MAAGLVTVFGASGFLGRHVVQRLAAKGYLVRAAVRHPDGALFLKPMGYVGQITPIQANIRNEASVRAAVAGADTVVNLVGILFESGRQRFDAVQAAGAAAVAKAAKAAGCTALVHVSALGASPDSPSRYARSKAAGEEAVRAAFPGAAVLRPSVLFGAQDAFFNRFARMAQFSPFLPVFGHGPGGTKFQPVYVGDVADAVMRCIEDRSAKGKTYELGGPRVYSFAEVMRLVLAETGRRRALVPVPFWLGSIAGFIAGLLPVPPITRDQIKLLKTDNVVSGKLPGLKELGIEPTAAELIVPTYLDAYRRGGRYRRALLV